MKLCRIFLQVIFEGIIFIYIYKNKLKIIFVGNCHFGKFDITSLKYLAYNINLN